METSEILIVEDDEILRSSMRNMLMRNRFKVFGLPFSTDIHKPILKKTPNLVILVSSPRSDRYELNIVQEVRRIDRRLPIIMITNFNSNEHIIDAFRMGVNDYLKISLEKNELFNSVRRCLSKRVRIDSPITETRKDSKKSDNGQTMIGNSPFMQEIKRFIVRAGAPL